MPPHEDSLKPKNPASPQEAKPDAPTTERAAERAQEEQNYTSVIVKRTDQARPHPDDVLEHAIEEGVMQLTRGFWSLLLSSVAGGLILGFSVMAVAVVARALPDTTSPLMQRLAMAFVYPLGFVICIMSGSQLFTEHTATAVYPFLDRRASLRQLLRLWAIVIVGNLIGTFFSAILIHYSDGVIDAREGYIEIARHLTSYHFSQLAISAVLAGWLMAQGAWMVLSTAPAISQMLSIYMVTFLIGVGGLHHSVAGSAEMFVGVLTSDEFTLDAAARFISTALLGNLVGGGIFVALLNYAHIRGTQQTPAAS